MLRGGCSRRAAFARGLAPPVPNRVAGVSSAYYAFLQTEGSAQCIKTTRVQSLSAGMRSNELRDGEFSWVMQLRGGAQVGKRFSGLGVLCEAGCLLEPLHSLP